TGEGSFRIEGSVPHVLHELGTPNPESRHIRRGGVQAIASGILLFTEEHWGQWLLTRRSEIRGAKVIALVRRTIASKCKLPMETWHSAGGEWAFSALNL